MMSTRSFYLELLLCSWRCCCLVGCVDVNDVGVDVGCCCWLCGFGVVGFVVVDVGIDADVDCGVGVGCVGCHGW